jgi:hypothetical protein
MQMLDCLLGVPAGKWNVLADALSRRAGGFLDLVDILRQGIHPPYLELWGVAGC